MPEELTLDDPRMLPLVEGIAVLLGGITTSNLVWHRASPLQSELTPLIRGGVMSAVWTERSPGQRGVNISRTETRVGAGESRPGLTEAREAVTDELSRHPAVLGRLVAVASLRDEQTGTYRHKLAANFGTEEMDRTLRRLHQEVFVTWLSLPLRQQQADVMIYMSARGINAELRATDGHPSGEGSISAGPGSDPRSFALLIGGPEPRWPIPGAVGLAAQRAASRIPATNRAALIHVLAAAGDWRHLVRTPHKPDRLQQAGSQIEGDGLAMLGEPDSFHEIELQQVVTVFWRYTKLAAP
jgi:hypothetical protein